MHFMHCAVRIGLAIAICIYSYAFGRMCLCTYMATFLCRAIIDGGMISHNEKLQAFTVKGTGGNVHAVRLFPKASCTCPASGSSCYHILAARISIGMGDMKSRHKVNYTLLRRNARSKKDKTSGRKRPRIDDYDITPAPDSIKNTLIRDNDCSVEKVSSYKSTV